MVTIWDIEQKLIIIQNSKELVRKDLPLEIFNKCVDINNSRFDKHFYIIKRNNNYQKISILSK